MTSVKPMDAPPPPYPTQPPDAAQYNATTVVVTQPMAPMIQHFRETPERTNCQFCRADIVTATYYETGTFTWVAAAVICIIGCDLGCCFIPFCLNSCKDVVHKCPNCHQVVGKYNRM